VDETAQTLVSIGICLLIVAGFGIWAIRESIASRKRATALEFDRIKRSVHCVEESLVRLDEGLGRIECRLRQRSESSSWEVRTLRSDLAYNRRELARVASAAGRGAAGACE
jgi:hypothetical protein